MVKDIQENVIEWTSKSEKATISLCQTKYINRIIALKEKYPDDVEIISTNNGDCIYARIPVSWVKINGPRNVVISEEDKKARIERLQKGRKIKL